jgi:uncharacterized protein YaiI (UPF0178 family)
LDYFFVNYRFWLSQIRRTRCHAARGSFLAIPGLPPAGRPDMTIWVDADACPRAMRDILFRAAERTRLPVTLVANQALDVPRSRYVRMLQVGQGFDVADNEIVARVQAGDLVVTADIPLAAAVIEAGGEVISPRGEVLDRNNIRERLNMRDFMDTLRASGLAGGGPAALSATDRQQFANALDRYLARQRA